MLYAPGRQNRPVASVVSNRSVVSGKMNGAHARLPAQPEPDLCVALPPVHARPAFVMPFDGNSVSCLSSVSPRSKV